MLSNYGFFNKRCTLYCKFTFYNLSIYGPIVTVNKMWYKYLVWRGKRGFRKVKRGFRRVKLGFRKVKSGSRRVKLGCRKVNVGSEGSYWMVNEMSQIHYITTKGDIRIIGDNHKLEKQGSLTYSMTFTYIYILSNCTYVYCMYTTIICVYYTHWLYPVTIDNDGYVKFAVLKDSQLLYRFFPYNAETLPSARITYVCYCRLHYICTFLHISSI